MGAVGAMVSGDEGNASLLSAANRDELSAGELKAELEAIRRGMPFVAYRDASQSRRIIELRRTGRVTVGRAASCDVWLDWDIEVSGLHAELERFGDHWVLADDGLSRNGTWVNGERLTGRRRLRDGDRIRCGHCLVVFRDPSARTAATAASLDAERRPAPQLSVAQRRVLVALCRPLRDGRAFAAPATNQEIPAELVLSVDAVKTHMRALFSRFELGDLPQNRKRLRLAELAFERGVIPAAEREDQSSRGGG
jgi:hypothetical protein